VLFQTAPGSHLGVILSVVLAAAVTFVVCMLFLLASRKRDLAAEGGDAAFAAAIAQTESNKGKSSSTLSNLATSASAPTAVATRHIQNIVFACDAGMGSSAMGASVLRNKIKKAGIEGVTVTNAAIANLDGTADLVITQQQLTDRAKSQSPNSVHVSVDNFMNSPKYDEVVEMVRNQEEEK
jgi:PTS system mannitol-specific IIC component